MLLGHLGDSVLEPVENHLTGRLGKANRWFTAYWLVGHLVENSPLATQPQRRPDKRVGPVSVSKTNVYSTPTPTQSHIAVAE